MLGRAGEMGALGYDGDFGGVEGFAYGMDGIPHLDGRSAAATAAAEKAVRRRKNGSGRHFAM